MAYSYRTRMGIALPCAAAFTLGCGLIDNDVELTSPTPWCDERGTGEVATVDLVQRDEDGTWVDRVITLLDAEGRTLTLINYPDQTPADDRPLVESRRIDHHWDGQYRETTVDLGVDGTIDAASMTTHDEEGRPVLTTVDDDNDGTLESSERSFYDEEGRLTDVFSDQDGDGTSDLIRAWVYEKDGTTVYTQDSDADGDIDRIETTFRDENGQATRVEVASGEGTVAKVTTYSYTTDGLLLEQAEYDGDSLSGAIYFEYDGDGQLVSRTSTATVLGVEKDVERRFYEYDAAGHVVTAVLDADADGAPEETEHLTYDDEGRMTREETRNAAGTIRGIAEHVFGEGPVPEQSSFDTDGDGTWDWRRTRTSCEPEP